MQPARHEVQTESELALLYRKYAPELLRYACLHLSVPQDAEDLVVDVFLAALEQAKFAAFSESAQRAWLWRVTRNKVIDAYRRTKTRHVVPLDQMAEDLVETERLSPEYEVLQQEDYRELFLHLQGLPAFQQAILRLRFGQELTCGEIATTLGKQENAVRVTLSRTLNRLRSSYRLSRGESSQ